MGRRALGGPKIGPRSFEQICIYLMKMQCAIYTHVRRESLRLTLAHYGFSVCYTLSRMVCIANAKRTIGWNSCYFIVCADFRSVFSFHLADVDFACGRIKNGFLYSRAGVFILKYE